MREITVAADHERRTVVVTSAHLEDGDPAGTVLADSYRVEDAYALADAIRGAASEITAPPATILGVPAGDPDAVIDKITEAIAALYGHFEWPSDVPQIADRYDGRFTLSAPPADAADPVFVVAGQALPPEATRALFMRLGVMLAEFRR